MDADEIRGRSEISRNVREVHPIGLERDTRCDTLGDDLDCGITHTKATAK
jgi:hypothetical protein